MAIVYFLATILVTLVLTFFAARRTKSQADYYAAGSRISGIQNGWAISGDFMSATTFLGLTALYFSSGVDVAIYYLAPLAGFCVMLLLIVSPLRRIGRFTLGDVMEAKLKSPHVRLSSGLGTIVISILYLVAQLVGAGALVSVLFGIDFVLAVTTVGALMAIYVAFGGMVAATWVQITKAILLVSAAIILTALCLGETGSFSELYTRAAAVHPSGNNIFAPGGLGMSLFGSISLAVGLVLGMAGMPHLLIRIFTVPDERQARRSITTATIIVGTVFLLLFTVVAPTAIAVVSGDARFISPDGNVVGSTNMVIVHLANALGGEILFGAISAIAFATILAVVAGLTMAVASASAHDVYAILKRREHLTERAELIIFRLATIATAVLVIALAIVFRRENVAFLSAMAFSVAASANFPTLVSVLYWKRTSSAGAIAGGIVGLLSSVLLIILGPAVWVKVFGNAHPIFPSEYPALITAPLAGLVTILVSLWSKPPPATRDI